MNKVKCALVGCSDPLHESWKCDIKRLVAVLQGQALEVSVSDFLFQPYSSGLAEAKAREINGFFKDPDMGYVFDVSGGDLANTVLPYLDFDAIGSSRATFFGYSDLSTIINAIVAKTGRQAVNYQVRNLVYGHSEEQLQYFRTRILTGRIPREDLELQFVRGDHMEGRILGGNTRCFQKLAATEYFPDMDGAILLLESLGGGLYKMATALEQYSQMGVMDRISGIILGTFCKMENEGTRPSMKELIMDFIPADIPVAETRYIGHNTDARAVVLG